MTSKQGTRAARIVVGMAAVLAVTLLCGRDATAARPSRCQARKLAASITEIRALLRCAQIDAGPECAASAATRRQLAFAREEARGGCTTSGDSAAIGTQVGVLVSALGSRLIENQHGASRCTSGQIAALRQAATRLSSIHLRNASTGDPARLVSDLAAARARFTRTYERALAKGDCRGSLQADLAWLIESGGVAAIAALLFEPAAQCPCWTAASLDATFPAGFFAANDRGGAVCNPDDAVLAVAASDRCDLATGPPDNHVFRIPRGGAGMAAYSFCVVYPDLDVGNTGVCDASAAPPWPLAGPAPVATTPAQGAACIAELFASGAFHRECD